MAYSTRVIFTILTIIFSCQALIAQNNEGTFITPFERSKGEQTATYQQVIDFYKKLDEAYTTVKMDDLGPADGGNMLQVVYYCSNSNFDKASWREQNKIVILINNGIHPGEPDGIDASMMLLRDAATGKLKIPENVVLAVIPVFNIGGCRNRTATSRVTQNGPKELGFRGNAQYLDLNRDFVKLDAAETRSLEQLMRQIDPDIFIDNHVSDGADYQHVMTLLATQHDKLGGKTGAYMYSFLTPTIYTEMKKQGYDLVPYVNDFDNTPAKGWREFYEPPRFSSGYTALFQTIAYVPETHMLKPFKDRVRATSTLMKVLIKLAAKNADDIKKVRRADRKALLEQKEFVLNWVPDTSSYDMIRFCGYEPGYKPSAISGQPRLYYDHKKPFCREVPFYDHFRPEKKIIAPAAYVIPAGWDNVIRALRTSGVQLMQLANDTVIAVTAYNIDNYETSKQPYERHYLHKQVKVTPKQIRVTFLKGDYLVKLDQPAKRYLVETLEPEAPDAFLAWNFFDGILQQKEYFSDYVFEDMAEDILKKDPLLAKLLEEKRKSDPVFAKNGAAQLDFIYRNSKYMEPDFMRYPVFRIEN